MLLGRSRLAVLASNVGPGPWTRSWYGGRRKTPSPCRAPRMSCVGIHVSPPVTTTAADVFENSKAARDAATAGSSLLADQSDLATFPLWVQNSNVVGREADEKGGDGDADGDDQLGCEHLTAIS